MSKESYTVESVVRTLNRQAGIRVEGNTIRTAVGITMGCKTWGKIDFLKKNGFKHLITNSIKPDKVNKGPKEDFEEHKRKKKKNGIDTLSGVKAIMKPSNFRIKK